MPIILPFGKVTEFDPPRIDSFHFSFCAIVDLATRILPENVIASLLKTMTQDGSFDPLPPRLLRTADSADLRRAARPLWNRLQALFTKATAFSAP
jgi:hypothetical protein